MLLKHLKTLELDSKFSIVNLHLLTIGDLKKAYHIKALNNHPDKNKAEDAKEIFQEIQEAYIFLSDVIKKNNSTDILREEEDNLIDGDSYNKLILSFLNLMVYKNLISSDNQDTREGKVERLKSECMEYSYKIVEKMLDRLNLEVLEEIYKNIDSISTNDFTRMPLQVIKNILERRLKSYNIYILRPSLNNLLNSDIYKLEIGDNLADVIYIPLWHSELNYDNFVVKIEPTTNSNIHIDDNNNIHLKYTTRLDSVFSLLLDPENSGLNSQLEINIPEIDNSLKIPLNELRFAKQQTYKMKEIGIPKINTVDILDNSKRADIIVYLSLI